MKQLEFTKDYIFVWEDGQSKDPNKTHSMGTNDNGNWSGGKTGKGKLIGSNHGVTPQALAAYRKVDVNTITVSVMHALTLEEAASIALKLYYEQPGLDKLPWDAAIASVMDFGWGAGQKTAIVHLQRMIGVNDDGSLGPATVAAYKNFLAKNGLEGTAKAWGKERNKYYESLDQKKFGMYQKGWHNRTAYFLPGTPWWKKFNA